METKVCCTCKCEKSVSEFYKSKKKSGLQTQCKKCKSDYNKLHYVDNREKYISSAKRGRNNFKLWYKQLKSYFSCTKCGEADIRCLDFHHLDRDTKEYEICSLAKNGAKYKLLKEMEKCIVLCSNCHRKEEHQEFVSSLY